jgi:hypothetical protein
MVAIGWLEAAPQICEIYNLKNFFYFTLLYLFFLPLQQKRLNRYARTMAQTTQFAVKECLLGSD